MDYLYKPGDAVRVRGDLEMNRSYYMRSGPNAGEESDYVWEEMMTMCGKLVHIDHISFFGSYKIKECDGLWDDEMFEKITRQLRCESLL